MEPRQPKPKPEPPLDVEGGETDESPPQPASESPGGMIGEGGRPDRDAPAESNREGGMIGQG